MLSKHNAIFENSLLLRKVAIFCGFLLLTIAIISSFLGKTYIVLHSWHDIWLPQLSAYAMKQGAILHIDFHTPFGFVYSYLNYIALLLIETYPEIFTRMDMIMLSSLLFSLLLLGIFVLMSISIKRSQKVSSMALLLVLSLVFAMNESYKHPLQIAWAARYNLHMWGLLFLQIIYMMHWVATLETANQGQLKTRLFAFIQAFCTFIAFNYKINFAVASIFVAISVFFFLSNKQKKQYLLYEISSFIILIGLVLIFSSYSYIGYIKDLNHIAQVKHSLFLGKTFVFVVLYTMILFVLRYFSSLLKEYKKREKTIYQVILLFLLQNKQNSIKSIFFDASIAVALFLATIGIDGAPKVYFLLAFLLQATFVLKNKKLLLFAYAGIVIFFFINIISLFYIGQFKFYKRTNKEYRQIALQNSQKQNWQFVVKNVNDSLPRPNYIKQEKSVNIEKKVSNNRIQDNRKYHAINEIQTINTAIKRLEQIQLEKTDKIMLFGNTNPLPILLNLPLYKEYYHWLRVRRTVNPKKVDFLYNSIQHVDLIYMPFFAEYQDGQSFMNCLFLKWNQENKRFVLFYTSQYGMLFATQEKRKQYSLPIKEVIDRQKLQNFCKPIEAQAK